MSWYFFGGFSAYLIVPSGRLPEPLGMLLHVGMVRRHLVGEVQRDLQSVGCGALDESVEVLDAAEPRFDRLVTAAFPPIAHGLPGSPAVVVRLLFRPFLKLSPIG